MGDVTYIPAVSQAPQLISLGAMRPGLFVYRGTLCFKSEYRTESQSRPGVFQSDAYVVETGEYFWGGTSDPVARQALLVMPLDPVQDDSDE